MLERYPKFYEDFHCLAGACPHTCCAKWEVVLDGETAALYRSLPGPLGERIRSVMTVDEDGDDCFPLCGGRCPFLDGENLCTIHRTLGEQATSVTCREHPRFLEDYGSFREVTLSASCPEANRLLFACGMELTERQTAEPEETGDPWLPALLPLRQRLLAILARQDQPIHRRLKDFLLLAAGAQNLLDEERTEELAELCPEEAEQTEPDGGAYLEKLLAFLGKLEPLESDWRGLLKQAKTAGPCACTETELQRVAEYGAFRYLLKCVNDGNLLGRAQFCVSLTLLAERLGSHLGVPEALRRLSCEIEHSEENMEAVLEAFWTEEGLSPADCFRAVAT